MNDLFDRRNAMLFVHVSVLFDNEALRMNILCAMYGDEIKSFRRKQDRIESKLLFSRCVKVLCVLRDSLTEEIIYREREGLRSCEPE